MQPVRLETLHFLFRQSLVLGLNALTGFLIVQSLDKSSYAVYTIIFSFLSVFVNLTNIGITPAMSGLGGKIWSDPDRLRALLNSALHWRQKIGLWALLPFAGYCTWQLTEIGMPLPALAGLVVLLLVAANVQIQTAFYAIVLQLNQAVLRLQRNELLFVLVKLAGIATILWTGGSVLFLIGWIVLCLFFNLLANQKLASSFLAKHTRKDRQYLSEIKAIIRSNWVRTLYWSFEGQISILLCALFATTETIADIGALGRLSVLFTLFQAFILNYSLPEMAKTQERAQLFRQTRKVLLMCVILIVPVLAWSVVHPASLLFLLGDSYQTLSGNLFQFLLAMAIGQLATVVYQICAAKAWIHLNRYYVPLALPIQAALLVLLDLSRLDQVILFAGANNLVFLGFNLFMYYRAMRTTGNLHHSG